MICEADGERLAQLSRAESRDRLLRRGMARKLAAGDLKLAECEAEINQSHRRVQDLRALTVLELQGEAGSPVKISVREITLNFGPYDSAWRNGLHGTFWALIFSAPWTVIHTYTFLSSAGSWSTYPILELIRSLIWSVTPWIAIGFFLGYFFPQIRGRNGLQKGLLLFLAWCAASIGWMAVVHDSLDDWKGAGFLALQVLSECLLMGLVAFDYRVLRRSDSPLQSMLQVHGFARLGISLTPIVATLGLAFTPQSFNTPSIC